MGSERLTALQRYDRLRLRAIDKMLAQHQANYEAHIEAITDRWRANAAPTFARIRADREKAYAERLTKRSATRAAAANGDGG